MLSDYQKKFLDCILNQRTHEDLLDLIVPAGSLKKTEALAVYRGDYKARLTEALGKSYEATWLLLGDEEFLEVCGKYISTTPSTLTSLTSYGQNFAVFLEEHDFDEDVVELANFERTFWHLFNEAAKVSRTLDPECLETAGFDLSMDIHLFSASVKLHQLWLAREELKPSLTSEDIDGPQFLAVYKAGERVVVKELSELQYLILTLFKEMSYAAVVFENLSVRNLSPTAVEWSEVFEILSFSSPSVTSQR